jgi:hypothetical protein
MVNPGQCIPYTKRVYRRHYATATRLKRATSPTTERISEQAVTFYGGAIPDSASTSGWTAYADTAYNRPYYSAFNPESSVRTERV